MTVSSPEEVCPIDTPQDSLGALRVPVPSKPEILHQLMVWILHWLGGVLISLAGGVWCETLLGEMGTNIYSFQMAN